MYYKVYNCLILFSEEHSSNLLNTLKSEYVSNTHVIELKIDTSSQKKHFFDGFCDNQTHIKRNYGYYYKKNIGFFEFFEGNKIQIYPLRVIDDEFVQVLLNYPLACIFFQMNYLCLHGSAVYYKDETYMFPGKTMLGKSSIAAKFLSEGAKLITEDTCIISINNNQAFIYPSYPLINLSPEINSKYNLFKKVDLIYENKKNNRNGYFINKKNIIKTKKKINNIIFLQWSDIKNFSLNEISKKTSFLKLISSSFLEIDNIANKKQLKNAAKLANGAISYEYLRKKDLSNLDKLFNRLNAISNK